MELDANALYCAYGALATVACILMCLESVSGSFIGLFYPGYYSLEKNTQIDWRTRFLSTVHAIATCVISFYAFFMEPAIREDQFWGHSELFTVTCAISSGYMLADLLILIWNYKAIGTPGFVLHHIVTLYAQSLIVTWNLFQYNAALRLFGEFSTPFVNLRYILYQLKMETTSLYRTNGWLMVFSFFISRILPMPYYYWNVWRLSYQAWSPAGTESEKFSICVVLVVSSALDCLNIYWFNKMICGAMKMMKKTKQAKAR